MDKNIKNIFSSKRNKKILCISAITLLLFGGIYLSNKNNQFYDDSLDVNINSTEATEMPEATEALIDNFTKATEAVSLMVEETVPPLENIETDNFSNYNETEISRDDAYANTWGDYLGRFQIPSVGVNVSCYASYSQSTVDADNSAAYYYDDTHTIIADHVNQGFGAIKSCEEGTVAYFSSSDDTIEYECVAVMAGINTGSNLTTTDGTDISEIYPCTLVCYTCNDNWQDITMVFFKVAGTDINDIPDEYEPDTNFYPDNNGKTPCFSGTHNWETFETFEYWGVEGEYRVKYRQDTYFCSSCNSYYTKTTFIEKEYDYLNNPAPIEPEETTSLESA